MRPFSYNRRVEAEISRSAEVRIAQHLAAEEVKAQAEAAAPQASGHYRRSFVITSGDGVVVVGNTDIAAHLIEWGSVKNPPFAPLRRGARAAGLHLEEH